MAVDLLTITKYALHRGCSDAAVHKAIRQGRITTVTVDGKVRVDPAVADIQWEKNTRARIDSGARRALAPAGTQPSASALAGAGEMSGLEQVQASYHHTRARREEVELRRAEISLAEAEGKLIERDAALSSVFTAFRSLRDGTMPIGRRLSSKLSTMSDPLAIQLLIDEAMREAFRNFHDRTMATLAGRLGGEASSSGLASAETAEAAG